MLIIEIALGIVLAYVLIKFWPWVLYACYLVITVVFIGVMILVAYLYLGGEKFAELFFLISILALGYGIPYWLLTKIQEKSPSRLRALINGDSPYNQISKLPIRIFVAAILALIVVGSGIGAVAGYIYLLELVSKAFGLNFKF